MIDHCTMVLYFCHGGNLTNNPHQTRNWWSEIVVMWLCIGNRVFHCCPDVYKAVLVVAYKLKVLIPKVLSLKNLYCPSCFSFPPCKFKQFLKRSGWKNHSSFFTSSSHCLCGCHAKCSQSLQKCQALSEIGWIVLVRSGYMLLWT